MGGLGPSPSFLDSTEIWDGTSWTEVNDLNGARDQTAGGGTTTAALLATGENPGPATVLTEIYDGTSWSEKADLNTPRAQAGGSGTSSFFLLYGGYPGNQAVTEAWNGTSWTEVGDLATGRNEMGYGSQGTSVACLATGGSNPGVITAVEEWSVPNATKTFTAS